MNFISVGSLELEVRSFEKLRLYLVLANKILKICFAQVINFSEFCFL